MTNNFPLPSLKLTAKALKNGWLEYIGILFSYGGQAYFQGHLLVVSKRVIGTSQQKNSLEKHTLRDHYRLLTQFRRDLHTPFLRISVICGRFVGGSPRRPPGVQVAGHQPNEFYGHYQRKAFTQSHQSTDVGGSWDFCNNKKIPERLEV